LHDYQLGIKGKGKKCDVNNFFMVVFIYCLLYYITNPIEKVGINFGKCRFVVFDAGTCEKKVCIKSLGMDRLVAKKAGDFDGQQHGKNFALKV